MKLDISTGERTLLIISGLFIAIVLAISFWYVAIPIYIIIFVWVRTHLEIKKRWQITEVALIVMVVLTSAMFYLHRPPVITIKEPQDSITVQKDTVQISGFVSPKDALLRINCTEIYKNNGEFSYQASLNEGKNTIKITTRTWFIKDTALTINRELTQKEKDVKAKTEATAKAKRLEAGARASAERIAWENSSAGRACKVYPSWTKEECDKLMAGKIWVGMKYEMLVYRWGKPDHTNLSNYGRGAEYQYCWDDYNPGCYYDRNDDGIIDAYN